MLLASVILIFAAALAAPGLTRLVGGRLASMVLALAPLAVFLGLLAQVGAVDQPWLTNAYPWAEAIGARLDFMLDGLAGVMALLISGIGVLILLFAGAYLGHQPRAGRFFMFLMLFMGAMLGIVLADNLILLFVFWELTSVTSFLLIGYDHERTSARRAATQALVVTGLGGLGLLGAAILLHAATGTWRISEIIAQGDLIIDSGLGAPIAILIFLAAFTKSAQVPFHFWLPNAMEAPTPVSAYLHSSTMVKAGVYLLARLHPALRDVELWAPVLTIVGAVTMVLTILLAMRERYLKRLLAYSTASALGVLVFLIGLGTELALMAMMAFLITHALYKGALFLVAGSIDHATGEKDITKLGGLHASMRTTFGASILAAASMAGIPLLFGFVGKELVMDAAWHAPMWRTALVASAVAMAGLTVSVALLVGVRPFVGARVDTPTEPNEVPWTMFIGPSVLALLSLVAGIIPDQVFGHLVRGGAWSMAQAPQELKLKIWHGFNPALYMSAGAIAIGIVLYLVAPALRNLGAALRPLDRLGPQSAYERSLALLDGVSRLSTSFFQSGYLRFYVILVLFTVLGITGTLLMGEARLPDITAGFDELRVIELLLLGLTIAGAIVAVRAKSRLGAVAALGVVGYAITLLYVLFGAPDLALTQFSIETLMVVLLVLVLYRLPRFAVYTNLTSRLRDMVIALAFGAMMTLLVLETPTPEGMTPVSDLHGAMAYTEGKGRNVVNVILVDFRALDTLGEITVLGIAAMGVFTMLRLRLRPRQLQETGA